MSRCFITTIAIKSGLWVEELLLIDFSIFVFFIAVAYFLHVLAPNKYIGYFAFIAFGIFNLFAWRPLHVATFLARFAARPAMNFSDFFGFEPYWESWSWFTLYWSVFCALLTCASLLLWPRGRETSWKYRLQEARARWVGPMRVGSLALLAAFFAIGGWAFYNTKVLNQLRSEQDNDQAAADYETTYGSYNNRPEPRATRY